MPGRHDGAGLADASMRAAGGESATHVVLAQDARPEAFGGEGGLLGDRKVRGPGAEHGHEARTLGQGGDIPGQGARAGVMDGVRKQSAEDVSLLRRDAGGPAVPAGGGDGAQDRLDLRNAFAGAKTTSGTRSGSGRGRSGKARSCSRDPACGTG